MMAAALATASAAHAETHDARWEAARQAIWTKELAIYAGRSRGDLSMYLANTASDYKAWPPFNEVPKGNDGLKATGAAMQGKTKEHLEMTFLDLALNGDTAVIYYKTHRTMLADGTPADEHFEVTHTWTLQDGTWKVLGGMARVRPDRPNAR
ncbi:nuclear transport factor 2 family protein [Novosphingobium resinovorum]|uniref:nuclear transport factor 2 family protein n=1 Tax=Novosphingobium resinovorum TaxID=158500 RepID=UPI002ED67DF3|nr:nuclear transport factor 2 family protein [Novosphingobium resinovorum]